jgi:hypothetical protein
MQTHPNTGREKAGVLPRMFAPVGSLWQQYSAQKSRESTLAQQRLKEEQARQDALSKYANSLMDKDLGTGTAIDPVITQAQADVKQVLAEAIKANPNMRMADLDLMAGKSAARIKSASDRMRALDNNIKGYAASLNKIPGVSGKDLEQMARFEMLYADDGKGGYRLKTIEEINSYDGDPVAVALEKHADKIVTREALDTHLAKLGAAHKDVTVQSEKNGVTTKNSVNVTYLPGLHDVNDDGTISTKKEIKDLSGVYANVLPNKSFGPMASSVMWSPDPGAEFSKSKKLPFPAKFAEYYPDGKIPQLAADAYDRIFGTEGGSMYLEKELKKQYPDLDKLSPYYETAKREVAFNLVKDYSDRTGIKTNDMQRNSPWVTKIQLGIPTSRVTKGDGGPGGGIDEKLNNSPLAIVARAMNGETSILEGARPETITVNGEKKQVMNFARGLAGNFKLPDDIFGKGVEARTVAAHPDDPNTLLVVSTDGRMKTFKGPALRSFFINVGKLQSPPMVPDDVQKIVNFYFKTGDTKTEGSLARYNQQGWDEASAKLDQQYRQERLATFKTLKSFDGSKTKEFGEFANKSVSIPGKPAKTIKSFTFKKGGWFSSDKYLLEFADGEKMEFTSKGAAEDFLNYIN